MQRFPPAYITETRRLTDHSHGHVGKSHSARASVFYPSASRLRNAEVGLKTVFISGQSTGNKRFVQMF